MRSATAAQFARSMVFLCLFFMGYAAIAAGLGLILMTGGQPQSSASGNVPRVVSAENVREPLKVNFGYAGFKTVLLTDAKPY